MTPYLLLIALAVCGYYATPPGLRRHELGPALRGLTLWFILCISAVLFFSTCYHP